MTDSIAISSNGLVAVFILMTTGWGISVVRKNVNIVDSLWGLGFVLIAFVTGWRSDGYAGRNVLVMTMSAIWGLRLSGYLTWRNWGQPEDHRYGAWREKSGGSFWWVSLFKVFWLQAVFLWTISLVLQKAQLSPLPARLTLLDAMGAIVWAVGFFFEALGDFQLARFKADPANRGRVMDRGLWALSRHPNYFGEFLIWWGFFLVALSTTGGWWTVVCPVIVCLVLLKMTGVPLTEAALKQRRPDYQAYIERTSAFFPRPPISKRNVP